MASKYPHKNPGRLNRRKTKNGVNYTIRSHTKAPKNEVEGTKTGDRTESTPENNHATAQERSPDQPLFTSASDEEVWQAYLAVEQEWEEVFRRLADS